MRMRIYRTLLVKTEVCRWNRPTRSGCMGTRKATEFQNMSGVAGYFPTKAKPNWAKATPAIERPLMSDNFKW